MGRMPAQNIFIRPIEKKTSLSGRWLRIHGHSTIPRTTTASFSSTFINTLLSHTEIIDQKDLVVSANSFRLGGGGFGEVFLIEWKNVRE